MCKWIVSPVSRDSVIRLSWNYFSVGEDRARPGLDQCAGGIQVDVYDGYRTDTSNASLIGT